MRSVSGGPAEPAPQARPGQDIRVGDIDSDIAGRIDMRAGRAWEQVPAVARPALDPDLQQVAGRTERPGGIGDARATTPLREIPYDAVLATIRVAGLSALAGDLRTAPRPMQYDTVRYTAATGWSYGDGLATSGGRGSAMAAFLDLVAAADPGRADRLDAAGGLDAAAAGTADFRDAWRSLSAEGAFQHLQDVFRALGALGIVR